MFEEQYKFRGKHADMVNRLKGTFSLSSETGNIIKNHSIFDNNYQIYELAPIIGFLYNRKATVDKDNANTSNIMAGEMIKYSDSFEFSYKLIMLLDKNNEPNAEKRIEKAFRGIDNKDDEALFDNYLLGGVEVLHEKIFDKVNTTEDIINKLYDFLEEFNDRYNDDIDMERVLELARKSAL